MSALLLSEDEKVRHANNNIKIGRTWKPQQGVREAGGKYEETAGVKFEVSLILCQHIVLLFKFFELLCLKLNTDVSLIYALQVYYLTLRLPQHFH